MMRAKENSDEKNIQTIPEDILNQNIFSIENITTEKIKDKYVYHSDYYFSIFQGLMATNLPSNATVKRLTTYLNWLCSDAVIYFNPIVREKVSGTKIPSLNAISFGDGSETTMGRKRMDVDNLEGVLFNGKNQTIKGYDVLETKTISVDLTDTNFFKYRAYDAGNSSIYSRTY